MTNHPCKIREPDVLTQSEVQIVRQHLKDLTASHAFAGSKRSQDFLYLIVGHALEGEIESLRERMIGAEMFGRPLDYDTGSDSVVRVKATEVRKKLAQFYLETDTNPQVRIELPTGSYVPRFLFDNQLPPQALPKTESVDPAQDSAAGLNIPPASVATSVVSVQSTGSDPLHPTGIPTQPDTISLTSGNPAHLAHGDEPHTAQLSVGLTNSGGIARFLAILTPRLVVALFACSILTTVAGAVGWYEWYQNSHARREIRSIAILPLKNLSGDSAQEYFADSMTEELINSLGHVSTLRVISLTSAMSYKDTRKKLPEIAHELAVDGVVEGSILREGSQVRISAQLIDAKTDRPIWAHEYVRNTTSVLALQGEVAQAVTDEVRVNMAP